MSASAMLREARAKAELARRDPSNENIQAARVAIAEVVSRLDGLGYNPNRDKGGRFAPGAHAKKPSGERAAARVAVTKARVGKAAGKLKAAKAAKRTAVAEARAALKGAKAAATLARKQPTAKNIRAAQVATNKATRAAAKVGKHNAVVAKTFNAHRDAQQAHAAAKAAHASAKADLKAARSESQRRPTEPSKPKETASHAVKDAKEISDDHLDVLRERYDSVLTSKEREATEAYTTGKEWGAMNYERGIYVPLNQALRGVRTFDQDHAAALHDLTTHMDSALSKATIAEPVVTYRIADKSLFAQMTTGDHFVDRGFVSTSTDRKFVLDYADSYSRGDPALMRITSPTGTKLAPVGGGMAQEKEMLIGRNAALRLDRREEATIDGRTVHVLHMTVVGQH